MLVANDDRDPVRLGDVVGRVDALEATADDVRRLQDASIEAVYDLVRGINREVGKLANELLDAPSNGSARKARPAARKSKPAARKPKAA